MAVGLVGGEGPLLAQPDATTTDAGSASKPTSIADASITAIDHQAEATPGIRYESIAATEHRTANGG